MSNSSLIILFLSLITFPQFPRPAKSQQRLCRKSCGGVPIRYPFGVDDGCGSPIYRRIVRCTAAGELQLLTPSGKYPIENVTYSDDDPHIVISDPFMWSCRDGGRFRPPRPFSLDTSTRFSLSRDTEYLFFNCSTDEVVVESKPHFCRRFPEECDSVCDSGSFLCRNLPECPAALRGGSCCAYYPEAAESLRMMLRHCATYTGVYWRNFSGSGKAGAAFSQVPEYGVRVDFEIPVTSKCSECEDGGGACGFDTQNQSFLCLCHKRNSTTNCHDIEHKIPKAAVAGVSVAVLVAAVAGIGLGVWYFRRVRAKAPVTHGVQTNDNRLF